MSTPAFPEPHQPRPAVPEGDYLIPPDFGMPALPQAGDPELDPLVPPPWAGLGALTERLTATLGRSWRVLGAIMLLTFALPQALVALVGVALDVGVGGGLGPLPLPDAGTAFGLAAAFLLLGLVGLFVNALGWAAGIWAVTQEAAGLPAGVGAALRAGAARAWPMLGWFLLFALMVGGGAVLCLLPGIYLGVAGSLFGLVVVFERRGGIGRSFSLVHAAFGAALGRVLLLFAILIVSVFAVGALSFGLVAVASRGAGGTAGSAEVVVAELAVNLLDAAVTVPVNMVLLVGLLLTYTQLRARREQISTRTLWAAANQP